MTRIPHSKLPVPVEVIAMDFLVSPNTPKHAVLELRTQANPIRVFLTRVQIEELVMKSMMAAGKVRPES
jgi:hypothetical protein